jgi:hypothetical protein
MKLKTNSGYDKTLLYKGNAYAVQDELYLDFSSSCNHCALNKECTSNKLICTKIDEKYDTTLSDIYIYFIKDEQTLTPDWVI